MTKYDDLRIQVAALVTPLSLSYFAKLAEMEAFLKGNQAKRDQLIRRWRKRLDAHGKQVRARQKARAGALAEARAAEEAL